MTDLRSTIQHLKRNAFDEQELAMLLNSVSNEQKVSVTFFFDSKERLWEACLGVGNDLMYLGSGPTLQEALIDTFEDYERYTFRTTS